MVSSDWLADPKSLLIGKFTEFWVYTDIGFSRGGEKISPLEIDAVFSEFEEVKEVSSFGAKDEILGEVVHICIVLQDGFKESQDLARQLREKSAKKLASFKVSSFRSFNKGNASH